MVLFLLFLNMNAFPSILSNWIQVLQILLHIYSQGSAYCELNSQDVLLRMQN